MASDLHRHERPVLIRAPSGPLPGGPNWRGLLDKYDRPVPRYTSYPTVPNFHRGVDAALYGGWLERLDPDARLSLYLHVPFCDSLCWFCGCHTKVVRRYPPIAAYLTALGREIDLLAERLGPGRPVTHIHWGGGSPTILVPEDMGHLAGQLRRRFAVAPDAEFAVEIDPRGLDDARIAALAACGVNRVSLGVQDIDPLVQRAVNRWQPFAVTRDVVARLRAAGIAAINCDLMYGLPHQDRARVLASVDAVLGLEPDRIALFGYAHLPEMKRHQRLLPEAALPDGAARLEQSLAAAERIAAAGYRPIGLDHFARPHDALARAAEAGRLRRNFQGYTSDRADALIGFGASAIGRLPQGFVQNLVPLRDYREALAEGRLPVARGLALSDDDRRRGAVIERLLCDLAVDLGGVDLGGIDLGGIDLGGGLSGRERATLGALVADGLVEVSGDHLNVTALGRPFVRHVAALFDPYLAAGTTRHSRAV